MTERNRAHGAEHVFEGTAGRRRELRAMLLSAADAARRTRVTQEAARIRRSATSAVRERVALLFSAVA